MTDDDLGMLASIEKRLAVLESTVESMRKNAPQSARNPATKDHVSEICDRIAEYARSRKRATATGVEMREVLKLGEVHGMTIDGALKRIERGAVPGVKAERFGTTHVPGHGDTALWLLTAE